MTSDNIFFSKDNLTFEKNKEPEWMKKIRLDSFKSFLNLPVREYAESPTQTAYTEIELDKIQELKIAKAEISLDNKDIKAINFIDAVKDKGLFNKYFMKIIDRNTRFNNLHASYVNNGLFILIPDNTKLSEPLKLDVVCNEEGHYFNHIILVVGDNCSLEFYENYKSNTESEHFVSDFLEVYVGKNSKVNVYSMQDYGKNVNNYSVKKGKIESNGEIKWIVANLGSKKVISNVDNLLVGEFAAAYNYGVFLGKEQHLDITTNAQHLCRNTKGDILVKGAVFDKATSVYRGEITVENEARQANSNLAGNTLVFEGGKANAIPSLLIKTNDVKVKHAAWVSQVDSEQLFYIMSRGLSKDEAVQEIILGHYNSIIDKVDNKDVREDIIKLVMERLS